MDDVSVFVCIPGQDGERWLRRRLDSVASQDIDALEVVLVDDGSTDGTLQIMRDYERRHKTVAIKVVEQENMGLAQGRCTGVRNSTGAYVTFLDCDDYLLDGEYPTVRRLMRDVEADIYEFRTIREDYYAGSPYSGVMDAGQVLRDYFCGVGMPVNFWLRWFRRELLPERVFPKDISLHEDVYAFPCILHNARTIAYINEPLHVHTRDESSIMGRHRALKGTREYFEGRKILLGTIPHIVSNIGQDVIEREYREPFACYVARTCRDVVFSEAKDVTFDERLGFIGATLGWDAPVEEVERLIVQNLGTERRLNKAIRILGLRNAYRLYKVMK